jgi:hypothetical protein
MVSGITPPSVSIAIDLIPTSPLLPDIPPIRFVDSFFSRLRQAQHAIRQNALIRSRDGQIIRAIFGSMFICVALTLIQPIQEIVALEILVVATIGFA